MRIFVSLAVYLFLFIYSACGQVPDSARYGTAIGKVKDSIYNFMLTSSTIAIYRAEDSSLQQYSLPNKFGEFRLEFLPINEDLYLTATHVGYNVHVIRFTIPAEMPLYDLGMLCLLQSDGKQLEDVVVKTVVPIRMIGDTLEFNADAFRMDTTATTEDLLRKLPGMTIWGDGEVTFNGKKINVVLVDGKPFMGGGNLKNITQNLPKSSIAKLQIYQERDIRNPLDSTLFANIKLKDGMKSGHFGKISAGLGTNERYTWDGMMSSFNKKLQVSAVGSINNVNKLASNIDVLLSNSSFKGEGINLNYQPDFLINGVNKPIASGVQLQYDFSPKVNYVKDSRLYFDYFLKRNNTVAIKDISTKSFLRADSTLTHNFSSSDRTVSTGQILNTRYEKVSEKYSFVIKGAVEKSYNESSSANSGNVERSGLGRLSIATSSFTDVADSKKLNAGMTFKNMESWASNKRVPLDLTLQYDFNMTVIEGNGKSINRLTSFVDTSADRAFDRWYKSRDEKNVSHTLLVEYPSLRRLLLNKRTLGGIDLGLSSSFAIGVSTNTQVVLDNDTVAKLYNTNLYLTNRQNASFRNIVPAFIIKKVFYDRLTNRYNKTLSISVRLKNEYHRMESHSVRNSQNFNYLYSRFIPDASVNYVNHQYGSYEIKCLVDLSAKVNYPSINQIAPLSDSANMWFIPKGNRNIKPEYEKKLSLNFNFTSRKPKDPAIYDFTVGLGQTEEKIIDSLTVDDLGRTIGYLRNMNGYLFFNGALSYKKSLQISTFNTFEFNGSYGFHMSRMPQYINSVLNESHTLNHNIRSGLAFRHRDILNFKVEHDLSFFKATQYGFDDGIFKSNNSFTRGILSVHAPRRFTWATNVTNHRSKTGNSQVEFTIWNASLAYRFLNGENGEIKVSALDLLSQNKGVVNMSGGNTHMFGYSNVLQQYFMLTFSYYPRKFGK